MKNQSFDLRGQNVVAGLFVTTVVVVLLLVFAFWIEVNGQGLSDFVKTMPLVTGAVGIVNLAWAFFLVWRHEDKYYCQVQKERDEETAFLLKMIRAIVDDNDFAWHLAETMRNPTSRKLRTDVWGWFNKVNDLLARLNQVGNNSQLALARDVVLEKFQTIERKTLGQVDVLGEWAMFKEKLIFSMPKSTLPQFDFGS